MLFFGTGGESRIRIAQRGSQAHNTVVNLRPVMKLSTLFVIRCGRDIDDKILITVTASVWPYVAD